MDTVTEVGKIVVVCEDLLDGIKATDSSQLSIKDAAVQEILLREMRSVAFTLIASKFYLRRTNLKEAKI